MYEFKSDDGQVIERFFAVANRPSLGSAITVDGKRFKRIVSRPVGVGERPFCRKSIAAPQWTGEGIKGVSHDEQGHVCFGSRRAQDEYCKQYGYAAV